MNRSSISQIAATRDPIAPAATSAAPSAAPGVAKAPCKSCPYRRDVPSGVWHESEYDKLPRYDGEVISQLLAGAAGLFMCHQKDGHLCAGWIATHGVDNLLALRMSPVAPEVWDYECPVPVFASGAEAAAHGMAEILNPAPLAQRTIGRLARKRMAARSPTPSTHSERRR